MLCRPKISVGDVVKPSKRLRFEQIVSRNQTMVVTKVRGRGSQKCDLITVAFQHDKKSPWQKATLLRPLLWKTGYNIFEDKQKRQRSEERNKVTSNEGRKKCLICQESTIVLPSLMKTYTVCNNPLCSWYKN